MKNLDYFLEVQFEQAMKYIDKHDKKIRNFVIYLFGFIFLLAIFRTILGI